MRCKAVAGSHTVWQGYRKRFLQLYTVTTFAMVPRRRCPGHGRPPGHRRYVKCTKVKKQLRGPCQIVVSAPVVLVLDRQKSSATHKVAGTHVPRAAQVHSGGTYTTRALASSHAKSGHQCTTAVRHADMPGPRNRRPAYRLWRLN